MPDISDAGPDDEAPGPGVGLLRGQEPVGSMAFRAGTAREGTGFPGRRGVRSECQDPGRRQFFLARAVPPFPLSAVVVGKVADRQIAVDLSDIRIEMTTLWPIIPIPEVRFVSGIADGIPVGPRQVRRGSGNLRESPIPGCRPGGPECT
ncbi:MAG: hypothetical protein MZU97_18960 [Bacillus subtilis]|nr:hypothetical protein [Bacillus subtilis]